MERYAMTVLGKLPGEELGFTYEHEHVYTYIVDEDGTKTYSVTDLEGTEKELLALKAAGVTTVTDMSVFGMGRNAGLCKALSVKTGVQIICASGFYRDAVVSGHLRKKSSKELEELILDECLNGVDYTDVRPGILKMAVSRNEITPLEKKIAFVMARVQKKTGMPLYCHLTDGTMGLEAAGLLLEAGADAGRLVLGHIDVLKDWETMEKICQKGISVSLDKFGREAKERDADRIGLVKKLIERGWLEQIFISSDMGNPKYLRHYGGRPGLDYLKRTVVPFMRENRIADGQIRQIFVENPRRLFCFLQ